MRLTWPFLLDFWLTGDLLINQWCLSLVVGGPGRSLAIFLLGLGTMLVVLGGLLQPSVLQNLVLIGLMIAQVGRLRVIVCGQGLGPTDDTPSCVNGSR